MLIFIEASLEYQIMQYRNTSIYCVFVISVLLESDITVYREKFAIDYNNYIGV